MTLAQSYLIPETKYSKLYINIILKAQNENRVKLKKEKIGYLYFENHHILPKSIFPEFKNLKEYSWNSVLLTAKEHYICHMLIWKHYKKTNNIFAEKKMGYALRALNNNGLYNSKQYSNLKMNLSHTEETKNKIREKAKLQPPMSDEAKIKCGDSSRGSKWVKNKRVFNSNEKSSRDCDWKKGMNIKTINIYINHLEEEKNQL